MVIKQFCIEIFTMLMDLWCKRLLTKLSKTGTNYHFCFQEALLSEVRNMELFGQVIICLTKKKLGQL